jgi:hypothetical protein
MLKIHNKRQIRVNIKRPIREATIGSERSDSYVELSPLGSYPIHFTRLSLIIVFYFQRILLY